MKLLLSIGNKWACIPPDEMVQEFNSLDCFEVIGGCETFNEDGGDYLRELALSCRNNGWILQIHAREMYDWSNGKILKTLINYNEISRIMNSKIKVTFHPHPEENSWYMHKICTMIALNNLSLQPIIENMENKNEAGQYDVDKINVILRRDVGFCWDIGHDAKNGNYKYILSDNCMRALSNVHIHDISSEGGDHYPFYFNNVDYKSSVEYLKIIGYNGNIVLEMAYNYLNNDDKFLEYIKQLELIANELRKPIPVVLGMAEIL